MSQPSPHPIPSEPVAFGDPRRTRTANGRPCWLHGGLVALPALQVYPQAEGGTLWDVRMMVEDTGGGYSWAVLVLSWKELTDLMIDWEADPEGTCRLQFRRPVPGDPELPRRVAPTAYRQGPGAVGSSQRSAEDLGL